MDAYNNVGIDSIETAKNLKKLSIENNLKLKQVRDAIGLSAEQTVCSWESKTHPKLPSIDNALNLARLYGVRLDQLYKTRPVKTGSPEKVDQEIRDRKINMNRSIHMCFKKAVAKSSRFSRIFAFGLMIFSGAGTVEVLKSSCFLL